MLLCLWMLMPAWVRLCLSLVGSGGFCQQEDHSGFLFHRSLVVRVPAAFGAVDPTAFTWVTNGGSTHRIDYVAVPFAWDCDHGTCT